MSLPDPRDSRAVLIGTSEYESLPQLGAVTANIEHLRSLFSAADLWGLPPENCTVLLNSAQPGEVLAAVREAAEAAKDTLVVYFAGHGLRSSDNDELYLALRTTVKDRMFTALRYDDLRRELLHTAAEVASKVVLLDCCYSGAAMQGTMSATDDVAERARIEGTYLMTASASTVPALAPKGERYTAFTGEIIDAISTGIPDGPDLLNMEKLFWHVRSRLKAKGLPVPQQRAGNNGGMISLVRNRRGAVTEPGSTPRRRRSAEVPAGLEFALSAPPQNLVAVLDQLVASERAADLSALLAAIAGRVDVQEIAALLDYLPYAGRVGYASVLLDAALRDTPERLVELMVTLRLLGQDAQVENLLDKAVGLAGGQASQLAELARLLREEHVGESRRLIASAIRAQAASAGPDSLISLVGALWSAGLGEEIESTLRESEVDLGEVDALALAKALNSAGRAELAVTLYLRGLDAVAALADDEIVAIVRMARECDRAEDAASLVRAALRRRETGERYTGFAMNLWSAGLAEDADRVLEAAASRLPDAELKHVAGALRANGHAEAAFELYRKAAADRSPLSLVEFVESLRASGRPVDALRLLTEAATRAPADLVELIAQLRARDRPADIVRLSALVIKRAPEELSAVISGLLARGLGDIALQYRDEMLRNGAAQGVLELVQALSAAGQSAMALECVVPLITELRDGQDLFAAWLCLAPARIARSFLPTVAGLDRRHALAFAKRLYELHGEELSKVLLGKIRFGDTQTLIAAFDAVDWKKGLEVFYTSKSVMSLAAVHAEYESLVRSDLEQEAGFLLEQAAMFRAPEQIPDMLALFAGYESAVADITRTVGRHRAPSDVADVLNVLNLKGRRLNRCAPAILAAAATRDKAEVEALAKALRARLLDVYVRGLSAPPSASNGRGSR
jgi:Caspase domain